MILSRLAQKISRPISSSLHPWYPNITMAISRTSSRSIATSRKHHSPFLQAYIGRQNDKFLDRYVGWWKETSVENYGEFLKKVGVVMSQSKVLQDSKLWKKYTRRQAGWAVTTGAVGSPDAKTETFRLNEMYSSDFLDIFPVKAYVFQEDDIWKKWQISASRGLRRFIYVEEEVNNDELTEKFKLDTVHMRRTYERKHYPGLENTIYFPGGSPVSKN